MSTSDNREWLIERVALGEVPDESLTDAERRRVEEVRADNADILSEYPVSEVVSEIEHRRLRDSSPPPLTKAHRSTKVRYGAMLALSSGLAAVLLFSMSVEGPIGEGTIDILEVTRLKGLGLTIHRKTARGVESLQTGDSVATGDRIQLGYTLDRKGYGLLVSLDGRGSLTVHLPEEEGDGPQYLAEGVIQLPFSYELDDAPDFERFFFVISDAPFDIKVVTDATKKLSLLPKNAVMYQALNLPESLTQRSITLVKRGML